MKDGILLELFVRSLGLWWVILPGMLLGTIVGILPGFSAQNTLIILLPLTLYMDINSGMAFMIALYCTTQLGGGIPAILFNMPGEGGAVATTLDGYPMTKKGQAQQALVLCFSASAFGGLITTVADHGDIAVPRQDRAVFPQRRDGGGDRVRPHADRRHRRAGHAQGHHRRVFRPDDRHHRRRPGVRHAACDLRAAGAVRRRAADPGADRTVRDLRGVRDAGKRDHRSQRAPDAGEERALERHAGRPLDDRPLLVADGMDVDHRTDHRHPARRGLHGRGVSRLPLFEAALEDAGALRHRPSARRHRAGIGQQRRDVGHAGAGVRARHSGRHHRRDHDHRADLPRHRAGAAAVHR